MTRTIRYGGSFREVWDENYHLTVLYHDQKSLVLQLKDGLWIPAEGEEFPAIPKAEEFFSQAASARVAAERFVFSGLLEQNLASLNPNGSFGPVFAAEMMRILMDEYGLKLEVLYPYILPCLIGVLSEEDRQSLEQIQPRTAHILQLLIQQRGTVPAARHDLRLRRFRNPLGAARTGEDITLSFLCLPNTLSSCALELYGDHVFGEYPMTCEGDCWTVTFPAPSEPAALWYRFRLENQSGGAHWLCAAPDGVRSWVRTERGEGFRLTVFHHKFETPDWFQTAILYQIFPDRFAFSSDNSAEQGIEYHRSLGQTPELYSDRTVYPRWKARPGEDHYYPDDFYGGRLTAIQEKLPYLKSIGITCIYLNPIVEARSNHRYDCSDYMRVDPILGTNADFNALCTAAERIGIRVICDGVFSHTGADSIYFNRDGHYPGPGACQTECSPWDSWYIFRHFPDDYQCWWGFQDLPEVDEHDPSWQEYVVTGDDSVVRHWLRLGASGWRLDVADELPDDVLQLIRNVAKEEKPDALILGEVWEDAVIKESYGVRRNYALGTSLDSVMNYPFRTAVLNFLHDKTTAFDLADFLTLQQMHYPYPLYLSLMNLLGSHDVERLSTSLAVNKNLRSMTREEQLLAEAAVSEEGWKEAARKEVLAAAIQFSIPGVPSIYYGDELGMRGTNDPFNRAPMPEDLSPACDSPFVRFAVIRSQSKELQKGKALFLASDPDVLVILRYTDENVCYTVINRAAEDREFGIFFHNIEKRACIPAQSVLFCQSL